MTNEANDKAGKLKKAAKKSKKGGEMNNQELFQRRVGEVTVNGITSLRAELGDDARRGSAAKAYTPTRSPLKRRRRGRNDQG